MATDHLARLIDAHEISSRDRDSHLSARIDAALEAAKRDRDELTDLRMQVAKWRAQVAMLSVAGGTVAAGVITLAVRYWTP